MSNDFMFFSDAHLRDVGSFPPFNKIEENGLSQELNNIILGFRFVADMVKKKKPKALFFLGDMYHTPEALPTSVIFGSSVALELVKDACIETDCKFYIMEGNHDILSDTFGINSISTLGGYGEIIKEDGVIDIDGFQIWVAKFQSDKEKVGASLEKGKKYDLIITHLDFKGARYETGKVSNSRVSPNLDVPVISGDIHLPQDIGDVSYIGSLVQNRFNRCDLDGVGGVLIFNTETKKITRIPNKYSKHYVKIEDLSQLEGLPPERCVLQVKCPLPDEESVKLLEGFEYIHIPIPDYKEQVEVNKKIMSMERPDKILRSFLADERPETVALFDEVISDVG